MGCWQHPPRVHLINDAFVPTDFLLEFQQVILHMVSQRPDPRPTAVLGCEFKERFTGLITDGTSQHALLFTHIKPILRQLIACQTYGLESYQMLASGVSIKSTLCAEVAALFSTLFEARRARGLLDGFAVLLALQDLVDAYHDTRSSLTMHREIDSIKSWPHNGSSTPLAKNFFEDLFARERLTEQDTRLEMDTANRYKATRDDKYTMLVRKVAPTWVTDIHSKTPQGSLNDYASDWAVYDRLQPEDTKHHFGMNTGHQGHVHVLPDLRVGFNGWAGQHNVHGMVDKEVVRELLERQDINSLNLILS